MIIAISSNFSDVEKAQHLKTSAREAEFPIGTKERIIDYDFANLKIREEGKEDEKVGNNPELKLILITDQSVKVPVKLSDGTDGTEWQHVVTFNRLIKHYTVRMIDDERTAKAREDAVAENQKATQNGLPAVWSIEQIANLVVYKNVKLPHFAEQSLIDEIWDDIDAALRGNLSEDDYPSGRSLGSRRARLVNYMVKNKVIIESCANDNDGKGWEYVNIYQNNKVEHYDRFQFFKIEK